VNCKNGNMNGMLRTSLTFLASSLLVACANLHGQLKPTDTISDHEGVFVLGLTPDNYRIHLIRGEINGDRFNPPKLGTGMADFLDSATDGYVIGKVEGGTSVGLVAISVAKGRDDAYAIPFSACGARNALVFEAPKGRVIYVTDIDYQMRNSRVSVRYAQRFEAARMHLQKNFPALAPRLELQSFQLLQTDWACGSTTISIPIYLGR
jgi:hypothetical protein